MYFYIIEVSLGLICQFGDEKNVDLYAEVAHI